MAKPKLISSTLMEMYPEGKDNHHIEIWMRKGLKMLKVKKKEDSKFFKLRVVDEGRGIWMIEDGQAITLLHKKDY